MRPSIPSSNMIIGLRPVLEAVAAGKEIDKVLVQKGLRGDLFVEVRQALQDHRVPMQLVPVEKLNRMTRGNHQGIIAFLSAVTFSDAEHILSEAYGRGEDPLFVLLDGVSDVRNFGAICRSAEALGAHAVIIPEKGAAQVNEDAVKTSAGALLHFPVCRVRSVTQTARDLQQAGLRLVAVSEKGASNLFDSALTGPVCLIMGSEEKGISIELMRLSDERVFIPMHGKTSSLNVSVAAGILLGEVMRQRSKGHS